MGKKVSSNHSIQLRKAMIIFLLKTPIIYMSFLKHDWSSSRRKNEFPLRKDVFTKFIFKLAQWFWRRKGFSKNYQSIVPYLLSSPFLKGCDPYFKGT